MTARQFLAEREFTSQFFSRPPGGVTPTQKARGARRRASSARFARESTLNNIAIYNGSPRSPQGDRP